MLRLRDLVDLSFTRPRLFVPLVSSLREPLLFLPSSACDVSIPWLRLLRLSSFICSLRICPAIVVPSPTRYRCVSYSPTTPYCYPLTQLMHILSLS